MASSTIPPLLCNTPPPMDGGCFEDDDDDDISMAESIGDDNSPTRPNAAHPKTTPPLPDLPDLPVPQAQNAATNDATVPPPLVPTSEPVTTASSPPPPPPFANLDDLTTSATAAASSSPFVDVASDDTGRESPPPLDDDYDRRSSPPASIVIAPSSPDGGGVRSRCDSPPSLDFHDPPSFADDERAFAPGDDEQDIGDHNDDDLGATIADLPRDDAGSISTASSMPSLQLSAAVPLQSPVSGDAETIDVDSELRTVDQEPTDAADDVDVSEVMALPDDLATTPCSASALDLSDSFEDFVEYGATVEPLSVEADFAAVELVDEEVEAERRSIEPEINDPSTVAETADDSNDFGADFSQFSAFGADNANAAAVVEAIDDDFGDFADVTAAASVISSVDANVAADDDGDDDDDFGDFSDFNDFQQSTAPPSAIVPEPAPLAIDVQEICARIVPLLNMMFPPSSDEQGANDDDDDVANSKQCDSIVSRAELNGDITRAVLNVDESLALRHQWLTSTGKAELVQALGIDTGKIWNQSMPRFAANLGFTPLEPMKPQAAPMLRPTQVVAAPPIDVPAAQFDWSGAGLVNPLDGVQEILHETGHPQNQTPRPDADWPLHRPSGPVADVPLGAQPSSAIARAYEPSHSEAIPSAPSSVSLPSLSSSPSSSSASTAAPAAAEPVSATRVLPGLAGGLKETHIFTPSKARTVSGSSSSNTVAAVADDGAIVIDETVVTKEYRDVEYNPQPLPSSSSSYEATAGVACLQPTHASIHIDWPEPGRVSGPQIGAFDSFEGAGRRTDDVMVPQAVQVPAVQKPPAESFEEFVGGADAFDDFSDFQYVPLPLPLTVQQQQQQQHHQQLPVQQQLPIAQMMPPVATPVLEPTPLAILQPQTIVQPTVAPLVNGSGSWPASDIDPDEMARLEAMFPTPKSAPTPQTTSVQPAPSVTVSASPVRSHGSPSRSSDDVEWSDFVSSDAGCQPITHIINQNILKHQAQAQQQRQSSPDEDDWTDFISGGSATTTSAANKTLQSAPNFPSWHHPSIIPAPSVQFANSWQTPIAVATPTFLPIVPAMPTTTTTTTLQAASPKHSTAAANGKTPVSPLDAHFFKPKPSISLIPDLAGLVFGGRSNGTVAAAQHQQPPPTMRK